MTPRVNLTGLLCAAALLCALPASLPAEAQTALGETGITLTATPALATDYLFRGISQSRNRPALQLTLDAQHESGLYFGAFGSNVAFPGSNARQEVDFLAGHRFELGGVSLDLGGVFYTYPGYDAPAAGYDFNYFELVAKGGYSLDRVKFVGTAAWSPDFYYESGTGLYLEAGADLSLPAGLTLAGRWGHQWIDRNARYGAPDYSNWSVVISREVAAGFLLSLGYYDTNLSKAECFGGAKLCEARALAMLSRPF